ncbi:uncharacterized protein J3R85_020004 [Psidium guajava]|nr:uncharacterized protein J3R85_020004 [Psidium guajava]
MKAAQICSPTVRELHLEAKPVSIGAWQSSWKLDIRSPSLAGEVSDPIQFHERGPRLLVATEVSTVLFNFPMLNERVLLEHWSELSLIFASLAELGQLALFTALLRKLEYPPSVS